MTDALVIKGAKELVHYLSTLPGATLDDGGKVLYQEAQTIMTRSKRDFVPVATGSLRATGEVAPPAKAGSTVTVVLGFGGPAAPYAIFVHEKQARHHVGQWKYLEQPVNEAQSGMEMRLAERFRVLLERAG